MGIELTIGVKVAIAIGVVAGIACGAYLVAKLKKRNGVRLYKYVSYENLMAFAQTCKRQYTNAVKSRVVCEMVDGGVLRITQLILDETLTAIKSSKGDVVGRIFMCKQVDSKIANRCNNKYPADFDMTI